MALQFVFGGSGSGKTHYLYKRILKEAGENPALNYIVLVPEQFTMQTQKDLVMMSDCKGIMNIDILSFGRLAYRIFEETGKGDVLVLDDEGKNLLLQKVANECEPKLRALKGNIKKLGAISEVKSVISEFDQYDIGLEELYQVMDYVGEDSFLYYKLKDISLMYEAFQKSIEDRFITKEEILGLLGKLVPESQILAGSVIVLDGFTGFTPVQVRLLGELLKVCKDVIVTTTIDDTENPYQYQHPYQLFGMSKHMVTSLIEKAKECQVEVVDPVWMSGRPYVRFQKAEELGFLEEHLFRYDKASYEKNSEAITIHVSENMKEEAKAAAARIRYLVRSKGYRYREIGVIVTDLNTYGDYLERELSEYEIPFFMDYKRSILLNSFVEYVRSMLTMVEKQFSYDSVFRFLRAGYGPFCQDDIELLENYCLSLGIKGYKKWQQSWIRRDDVMTEEELSHINHLRVQFVELMDPVVFVLRQRKKTVRDITECLYEFIEKEKLQEKLEIQKEEFEEEGQLALAREYAQVYEAVITIFDKFVELLGDEPVGVKEYSELLDAALEEAKIGVIPPGLDQVIVGDVERTRLKDIRALFVLGINDNHLPGSLLKTGLLGERDRDCFEQMKLRLTPGGKEKAYMQKFYLYLNLTKPEEMLYLSYSRTDNGGKSIRPAYLIGEIRKLFPQISVVDEKERRLLYKELTPGMGVDELIRGLHELSEEDSDAWMELYNWYQTRPEWADKMAQILEARFWNYNPVKISEEAARLLYGEKFRSSISRMERFSACAFAHFLTYGLRVQNRAEYEFDALDLGNVFHTAIEKYSWKLKTNHQTWTEISDEDRKAYVKECVEESVTDYGNSVLYASARSEYMITRLHRLMDRTVWALTDQLKRGDFVPEAYEMKFHNGKIDRVDLCYDDQDIYVKVIDYKTGRKAFDISALYHGLQMQLMVYMDATVDAVQKKHPDKEVIPAGVFYYRIDDPYVDRDESKDLNEKLLEALRMDGIVHLKKNSLEHLDRTIAGASTVVPVKFNKNGSLSKTSKVASEMEFDTMLQYSRVISDKIRKDIQSGDVSVHPYRQSTDTGCDYCNYKHICGFDTSVKGYEYNEIHKLSKDEVISKMRSRIHPDEGAGSWQ